MRIPFIANALLVGACLAYAPQARAVGCNDVIKMLQVGLSPDVVANAVKGANRSYSKADIQCLKDNGVPPQVLKQAEKQFDPQTTSQVVEPSETLRASSGQNLLEAGLAYEEDVEESDYPSPIKAAIATYRDKRYREASSALYRLLAQQSHKAHDPTLRYYLGRSLLELSLVESAEHYLASVVQDSPESPYVTYALRKLVDSANLTRDDAVLERLIPNIPQWSFPSDIKSHLLYVLAVGQYASKQPGLALANFQQIPPAADTYLRARYFEGLIHHKAERYKSAVRAFREIYQAPKQSIHPVEKPEAQSLKDLSLLNVARIYYQLERFKNADQFYRMLTNASEHWTTSLFELAWSEFLNQDLNATLGLLLTLNSPHYARTEYRPEVSLLRALTFYNLCHFTIATNEMNAFKQRYEPYRDELTQFIATYAPPGASNQPARAIDDYFGDAPVDTVLSVAFFSKVLRNRSVSNPLRRMARIDAEIERISLEKPEWLASTGEPLIKILQTQRSKVKQTAGLAFIDEMNTQLVKVSNWLVQARTILFDIADAQRADYESKALAGGIVPPSTTRIDFATATDVVYWPFNGEFWSDELGYYLYTEKETCN